MGVAMQMKKKKFYTTLDKKTFSIVLPTQSFKNCFHWIVGNKYLFESEPHHAIVYIPTRDFGQNL